MINLNDKWYEAIKHRRSIRDYSAKSLDENVIKHLMNFTSEINNNNDNVRIVFVNERSENVFKGVIGGYGKISDSPSYAVFIEDTEDKNCNEKLGYYGEAFVLEATTLGLGTCWVSGTFNLETVKKHVTLSENEKIHSVTPIGYAKEKSSFASSMISTFLGSTKRKSLQEISSGLDSLTPKWISDGIEAARIAPSAINKQPWHFKINENSVVVSIAKGHENNKLSPRLDCGIAMIHFEIGAKYHGISGEWEYMLSPEVAAFKASVNQR